EIGDVAVGTDLLTLDDDRADQPVEHRVRQIRCLAGRSAVGLRPQGTEAAALGQPPSGVSRARRILAGNVDVNAADLERTGAVERQDTALAGLELRIKRARQ